MQMLPRPALSVAALRVLALRDLALRDLALRVLALLAPAAFVGGVSGVLAGWTAGGYWALQALACAGALFGTPHRPFARTAGVGFASGFVYGGAVALGWLATSRAQSVELADPLWVHPLVTAVLGVAVGAAGSAIDRARVRRTDQRLQNRGTQSTPTTP